MSTCSPLLRACRYALIAAAAALPHAGALAQLQSNESQPGGVEALPKQPVAPGTLMRSPAPPPPAPAPIVGAPVPAAAAAATAAQKPPVPVDMKRAKDDGKASTGSAKKSKKSFKKSTSPDGVMSPRSAPAAPSTQSAPTMPGDESRPGGVERAPTIPLPKQ